MADEQTNKARAALWLKSEEALGLKAVKFPRRKLLAPGAAPRPAAATQPPRRPVTAASSLPAPSAPPPPRIPATRVPTLQPPALRPAFGLETQMKPPKIDTITPFTSPLLATDQKRQHLQQLDQSQVKGCIKCRLCEKRTNTVFGEGDPDARLLFIGEGPGETEDLQGRPFVGKAGQLLTKMIAAMGLQREDVYIANIVKCRPPGNRVPAGDEIAACTPYLLDQIETIRPRVIVTLGLPSTRYMLGSDDSMGRLRGKWYNWRGLKLLPTYHPSYVLRSYTADVRATVWGDLKLVMAEIGLNMPGKKGL